MTALLLFGMLSAGLPQAGNSAAPTALPESSAAEPGRLTVSTALEPLGGFVENRGQWPDEVRFFARAGAVEATVLCDGFVLRPVPAFDADGVALHETSPVFVRFAEGACASDVAGVDAGSTLHHFFRANGSASNALGYGQVRFESVWPGVDLVLRRDGGVFAYDLHLDPGAELDSVGMEFTGVGETTIAADGRLISSTPHGPLEQLFGAAWEVSEAGERIPVEPRFVLEASGGGGRTVVRFEIDDRDPERALVIDPTLVYSTYVGGSGPELEPRIAADEAGNVFLTCRTGPVAPTTPEPSTSPTKESGPTAGSASSGRTAPPWSGARTWAARAPTIPRTLPSLRTGRCSSSA